MKVYIDADNKAAGLHSGNIAGDLICAAIEKNGQANIVLATGASQFETLKQLIARTDIEWNKVVMFHLDEYIDLSISHPASFRKYLKERFLDHVPPLKAAHLINGEVDAEEECKKLNQLISQHPVDVALVGIGENCHLAFNDPPANFDVEDPYIITVLDDACKTQQVNEGWFAGLNDVPKTAISMSVKQIMRSKQIICTVPDQRKAQAVKNTLEQPVSNLYPASILQQHSNCSIFLDKPSASLLSHELSRYEK